VNVRITELVAGARSARGLAVIIDVFRASSSIVAAFAAGAERIVPAGDLEEACRLKRRNPAWLLFGERDGLPPRGFDSGNSPPAILRMDLRGKTIVFTTSAGTQGIVNATGADEIVIGSFLNAGAVADYATGAVDPAGQHPCGSWRSQTTDGTADASCGAACRTPRKEEVTLVAMGVAAIRPSLEDRLCAEYIRALILREEFDLDGATRAILADPEAAKFFDPANPICNPDDVHLSLTPNRFRIVPRCEDRAGLVALRV